MKYSCRVRKNTLKYTQHGIFNFFIRGEIIVFLFSWWGLSSQFLGHPLLSLHVVSDFHDILHFHISDCNVDRKKKANQ